LKKRKGNGQNSDLNEFFLSPVEDNKLMGMKLLKLTCPACNYTISLLEGTQGPDQTYADLNEDFAFYKLFLCPVDNLIHSININDREFKGNCPEHPGTKLLPLKELPKSCTMCEGALEVTEEEILKPSKGE